MTAPISNTQSQNVCIAMSGGVDSSVSALFMHEAGFSCIGATMLLCPDAQSCGSLNEAEDARSVAALLSMPFHIFNFTKEFAAEVIARFVHAYEIGATPNPCICCNRHLKFGVLFEKAKALGCTELATGHYARISYDEKSGRYLLKKAVTEEKDQSYVLYNLTQEQLAHTHFPLGELEKEEVRQIAAAHGFVSADKKESQDICFVPDGDYASFIERFTGKTFPEGDFVNVDGTVMGRHKGIIRYTVGQRKGLGLALPEPAYVCRLDMENNAVILGKNDDLFSHILYANDINLIAVSDITKPLRVKAKVRYRQKEQWATVTKEEEFLRVEFDEPQRAITKGQAVVLYDEDTVIGGGTICAVGDNHE